MYIKVSHPYYPITPKAVDIAAKRMYNIKNKTMKAEIGDSITYLKLELIRGSRSGHDKKYIAQISDIIHSTNGFQNTSSLSAVAFKSSHNEKEKQSG